MSYQDTSVQPDEKWNQALCRPVGSCGWRQGTDSQSQTGIFKSHIISFSFDFEMYFDTIKMIPFQTHKMPGKNSKKQNKTIYTTFQDKGTACSIHYVQVKWRQEQVGLSARQESEPDAAMAGTV